MTHLYSLMADLLLGASPAHMQFCMESRNVERHAGTLDAKVKVLHRNCRVDMIHTLLQGSGMFSDFKDWFKVRMTELC